MLKKIRTEKFAGQLEWMAVMLILVLVLAFMLVLCFSAYTETSFLNTDHASGENIDIYGDNVFLNLILLVVYLCLIYLFYQYTDSVKLRTMELVLYGWMFFFGCLFIMTTKLAAPVDSFSMASVVVHRHEVAHFRQRLRGDLGIIGSAGVFHTRRGSTVF